MKTKSISLILVLAILITIGGVYAAWLYAETPLTAVHGHIGSFGLATAVVNNSKGTIEVDGSNAHLSIDQTAANDYTAKLVATGDVVVTFRPSEVFSNSNQELAQFTMEYKLVTTGSPDTFTCNDGTGDKLLFTRFNTTTKKDVLMVRQSDGTYKGTISAQSLITDNLIAINTFTLNTIEKHTAFSARIGTFGNIGIEVSEKTPAADLQ